MVAQRDYFARSEDMMRNKLVVGGVAIFRERLQRKEEKKEQASRRKAPCLTLRDAFARRRAREQATSAIEQEDAAKGFAQEPPAAECVEEEPYYEEEEDEVVEEVPLDPAQVQAALEAEREKKRLRDIESAQMQKRFKEKKRLPKYQERAQQRSTLPAYQMKDQIVDAIDKNSVVVISGDTGASRDISRQAALATDFELTFSVVHACVARPGCGKTTQVPQFVLDEWIERGRGAECSIIVTQPRRISAMSVRLIAASSEYCTCARWLS
jgi:HrpA-like RNA helicase